MGTKINLICIAIFFCVINFVCLPLQAINGYKITLKSNVKNAKVYMYYQYGESTYARDTSLTNGEGVAVFEKHDTLTGGVFMIYLSPTKAFEFLLTAENIFTVQVDTNDVMGTIAITGSTENTAFYSFLKEYHFNSYQLDVLKQKRKQKSLTVDSVKKINTLIYAYEKQLVQLKKKAIAKNPNTFVANLLQAELPVDIPNTIPPTAKQNYLKAHFLDNINFSDSRLAYSTILLDRYTDYIGDFGLPNPDSVIACCNAILHKASASKEIFKWSLFFLGNSFERSSVAGQDKIFVYLVENYYKKNKSWWLTPQQLNKIYKRSDVLKNLFIGVVCPNFTAVDSFGKEITLHEKITKKTVLYFWSYDCKHCLKETPILAQWIKNHPEINLITACVLPDEDEWKQKLREFKIQGTHLIDADNKANFVYTYSLFSTPQIFVIDKNKKIVAKYISDTEELDAFLKHNK